MQWLQYMSRPSRETFSLRGHPPTALELGSPSRFNIAVSNTLLTQFPVLNPWQYYLSWLHLRPVTARISDLRYPKAPIPCLSVTSVVTVPFPFVVALSTMATQSVSQQTDILNSIFVGLRSKSPETRLQSALDLRRYVCLLPLQPWPVRLIDTSSGRHKGSRNVLGCRSQTMGGLYQSTTIRSCA